MSEEEKNKEEQAEGMVYESEEDDSEKEKLKKKLSDCRKEKEEYLAGWQRSQADFINYRRRQEEQAGEWAKLAGEKAIKNILPFLDSLDAAVAVHPEDKGLVTLKKQLLGILKNQGLEEIEVIGKPFDPELHEVIECEDKGSEHGGEIVSGEIQKGYFLNGKVLRAAKVKVIKK
ncbi:MAG: nucleotide exchange factor GrpE [Candidatus Portnoybacteria bacterium]|nr:nucleotide exchange factor GrpE [Candidatus Portnoybacteria bacterium]